MLKKSLLMFASRASTRALLSRNSQRVRPRRDFTVSTRYCAIEAHRITQGGNHKASGWSQPKVLAVAVGAGALGWGLASFTGDNDSKKSIWDQSSVPRYATLPEMEKVGYPGVSQCAHTNSENRPFDELRVMLE